MLQLSHFQQQLDQNVVNDGEKVPSKKFRSESSDLLKGRANNPFQNVF